MPDAGADEAIVLAPGGTLERDYVWPMRCGP